jgi:hypothetical protein
MIETKLITKNGKEEWKDGYFLSIDELQRLVRDFQVDCHDGFVSNDKAYIESWLKKNDEPHETTRT